MCSGAATTARGMLPGHPAVGSRDGPWGTCPTRKGAKVLRHRGVGSPPTSGVYAIEGGTRGSGKRRRYLGWGASARKIKIQCAKRLARAQSALDRDKLILNKNSWMASFRTPDGGIQQVRAYLGIVDESEIDDDPSDGEVSDHEEKDRPVGVLFERNKAFMRSHLTRISTTRHPEADADCNILIMKKPSASKMPYKYLHPSLYCNMEALGNMDQFASRVHAPTNWRELHEPLVVGGSAVRTLFDRFRSLPDDASEQIVNNHFAGLVSVMSIMLGVHCQQGAETNVIVGGILALTNYDVRSKTDVHFLKNGRNIIATELKTEKSFPEEVWYRKSSGVQLLCAMYAHNAPAFLCTQKRWKLFVQNEPRNSILTFPDSFRMHTMGPTFLQAITICLLSNSDSETFDALSSSAPIAIPFASPKPTNAANAPVPGSVDRPAKRVCGSDSGTPQTGAGGGFGGSCFKVGVLDGKDVYSYVRVVPEQVVKLIEDAISAETESPAAPQRDHRVK